MVPPEPPGPTPIPVEGDVQIFADPECTRYAVGNESIVYARINVQWLINEGWSVPKMPSDDIYIYCGGPTTENPDDAYYIFWYFDWISEDYYEPFNVGQIVPLNNYNPEIQPIDNPQTVFSPPP